MSPLRAWFAGRSLRERRLLVVMFALLAVTLVWLGIILPVRDGLASTRDRYDSAVVRLGETENAADALRGSHRSAPLTGLFADVVRQQAEAAGFTVATFDQQGAGRAHLTIQSGRGPALSAWFAHLERVGIIVDAATLRDNGDGTLAADLVLRTRGA